MSTTKPDPIPSMYRRVTPSLVVKGGVKALEFYAEVFGATERMRIPGPDGTVAHSEVEIGDSVVMVDDASPEMGTEAPPSAGLDGSPTSLYLYVEDVDATVAHAGQVGATVVRAPQDQFYGDRNAYVIDPFGHGWTVASHVEDVAPDEMLRRVAALQAGGQS
jgi:PhnB protein